MSNPINPQHHPPSSSSREAITGTPLTVVLYRYRHRRRPHSRCLEFVWIDVEMIFPSSAAALRPVPIPLRHDS